MDARDRFVKNPTMGNLGRYLMSTDAVLVTDAEKTQIISDVEAWLTLNGRRK